MTTTTQAVATRPAATVVVVSTAGFLVGLDLFIVNIAFAEIRQTFGAADFGAMSWILNAYTLVFAAFMNPAGRLGDRYGHRRIFLCGLVVFTRGSALCGLSGSFVALVGACRPGPGCGDADAEFARAAAGRRSGRPACRCGQHLVGSGGNGSRTRTPVGGYLVELSWRWIFFVNVPVGLLALIAGLLVLAKTPGTGSGVPDYWVR